MIPLANRCQRIKIWQRRAMPQVSIIVNVRNGAATLRETIDSVLAQSFSDWELVIWDDCSTDESARIVTEYRDSRIRYFLSPEDVSLGKARGQAIAQARGPWIAFLDQDDIWLPGKLQKQMSLANEATGMIYGRTVRFYPTGLERDYDQTHEFKFLPQGDIFPDLFLHGCFIAMSSTIFHKAAIEAVGGIPDEIDLIPDYYLYTAVARRYPVKAVQEAVCRYRMHPANMSKSVAITMHREALWLVEHWQAQLDPAVASKARRRHLTAIALEQMRDPHSAANGLMLLLTEGSVLSQLLRPPLFLFHLLRRHLRVPYWQAL